MQHRQAGALSQSQREQLAAAESLVANWMRDGGMTYRELVIELWLLGGVECSPEIAAQRLQVQADAVDL